LARFVRDHTSIALSLQESKVRLADEELFSYPFIYITGHGNISFAPDEMERLRRYLEGGGFIHADDNYGMDESFRREMAKVFPDNPLVEVPLEHPVYHIVYEFPEGVPKIHEHDNEPAQGFGIFLEDRLAVFYSYQTDLGDGWEDTDVHDDPEDIREKALQMGVNLFVYAVTAFK